MRKEMMMKNDFSEFLKEFHPTVVKDFAGIGGLSYGFKQAGYRTLFALDNDPHAVESHKL